MLYNPSAVFATTDAIAVSATTTTTSLVTIPANRYFAFNAMISASQNGAGTATPRVILNNTTAGSPAAGSSVTVAELSITGALGVVAGQTGTTDFTGYSGNTGATLDFNLGGATGVCCISGYLE